MNLLMLFVLNVASNCAEETLSFRPAALRYVVMVSRGDESMSRSRPITLFSGTRMMRWFSSTPLARRRIDLATHAARRPRFERIWRIDQQPEIKGASNTAMAR